MSEKEIVDKLKRNVGSKYVWKTLVPRAGRVFVGIDKKKLKDAIRFLKTDGFTHLSAITGLETEGEIELLYHLSKEDVLLTIRVRLPLNEAVIPSITDHILGATLYEQEIHDLLGVNFEGHPNLAPLILPDDWPNGVYPLRKSQTAEKGKAEREHSRSSV
ncbi:MAG: NADH-quinone oxidoreductase subunit C [Candidatus Bathyarchaeota archaeon]|nr:NADH-quinone oxidoreductase subunit C [Candidatus Bathyarchaeota archaeon]